MTKLALQIAPQRSTQYATLARSLAPHELKLCPLNTRISDLEEIELGGECYLTFNLDGDLDDATICELNMLAMTGAIFVLHGADGNMSGPLLQPIEPVFKPTLPSQVIETRRYRGKTNEMFTQFLCNLARYASGLAERPWSSLRVFDPLAGGGTTLFTALVLGADAAGVEQDNKDVSTTVSYVREFLRDHRISHQVKEERLKRLGSRATISIGKDATQRCIIARGDTADSQALLAGFHPHLIVTDLPYGIQHQGKLVELLARALPVWAGLLPASGALVFSWDATRFPREEMVQAVETGSALRVPNDEPYASLSHPVDRVIKRRDVLVARAADSTT